ncbi:unnamed protein product [Protopolystoma xenopodis]|uniref:Uncharacterized protein n=1 Tax=Protopolystoma xenopodis TaxID=117903 RepID=A0A448XDM0_9PLAT|nr:unnamed protein product [Protopolystoma xenopodis]
MASATSELALHSSPSNSSLLLLMPTRSGIGRRSVYGTGSNASPDPAHLRRPRGHPIGRVSGSASGGPEAVAPCLMNETRAVKSRRALPSDVGIARSRGWLGTAAQATGSAGDQMERSNSMTSSLTIAARLRRHFTGAWRAGSLAPESPGLKAVRGNTSMAYDSRSQECRINGPKEYQLSQNSHSDNHTTEEVGANTMASETLNTYDAPKKDGLTQQICQQEQKQKAEEQADIVDKENVGEEMEVEDGSENENVSFGCRGRQKRRRVLCPEGKPEVPQVLRLAIPYHLRIPVTSWQVTQIRQLNQGSRSPRLLVRFTGSWKT